MSSPPAPCSRSSLSSPVALLLGLALVVGGTGCAADGTRTDEVGAVQLQVPRAWEEVALDEPGAAGDVVAQRRWSPRSERLTALQVVVGCGDQDADELTIAAATEPRDPLVVTFAEDATREDVPGLEAARRTVITLGAGREDDAETLRLAGVYGSGSGGLVLVEYSAPVRRYDAQLADELLTSVEVDAAALEAACADR